MYFLISWPIYIHIDWLVVIMNFYFRSIDETGTTPVHIAAMWGEPDCLQILLANGGDPFLEDQVGTTKVLA